MIKRLLFGVSALLLLGLVTACSAPGSMGAIEDAAQQAETDPLAKRMADQLLGEVNALGDRSVRMCMISNGIAELVAWRMSKEPDQAVKGYGQIAVLRAGVDTFEAADTGMWFNTDVALMTLQVTEILIDNGKSRVLNLASNFAGGINVMGVLDRAAIAAGQASLMAAVIADIKVQMKALAAGQADPAQAMLDCKARIDRNQAKVGGILGAVSAVAEPGSP